jgi:hypothetical protein
MWVSLPQLNWMWLVIFDSNIFRNLAKGNIWPMEIIHVSEDLFVKLSWSTTRQTSTVCHAHHSTSNEYSFILCSLLHTNYLQIQLELQILQCFVFLVICITPPVKKNARKRWLSGTSMGLDDVSELRPLKDPGDVWAWRVMVEWYLKGKPKNSERNPSQCHFVHHKFHMDWPGCKPGLLRWEACN